MVTEDLGRPLNHKALVEGEVAGRRCADRKLPTAAPLSNVAGQKAAARSELLLQYDVDARGAQKTDQVNPEEIDSGLTSDLRGRDRLLQGNR